MSYDLREILIALLRDPEVATALREALSASQPDQWLTLAQAAEVAQCEPRVLRDAGRRVGGLQLGSAGGEPRVRLRELNRWLATEPRRKPRKASVEHAEPANDTSNARDAALAAVARAGKRMERR